MSNKQHTMDKLSLESFAKLLLYFIGKYISQQMGLVLTPNDDAYSAMQSAITAMLLHSTGPSSTHNNSNSNSSSNVDTDDDSDGYISEDWLDKLKSDIDIESTLQTIVTNAVTTQYTQSQSRHPQSIDAYGRRLGHLADTPSLPSPPAIVQIGPNGSTQSQNEEQTSSEDEETPQLFNAWSNRIVNDIVSDEKETQRQIAAHIEQTLPAAANQNVVRKQRVLFDQLLTSSDKASKVCILQSRGLRRGYHQWTVEVLQSDIEAQEMGVVGTCDIKGDDIAEDGVLGTDAFGARAVFGNELAQGSIYVGAKDTSGKELAYGDLSKLYRRGWCTRDVIKVCLDLDDWTIQFFLNGKAVKGMEEIELEPHRVYHPVIVFGGNCRFKLHHY